MAVSTVEGHGQCHQEGGARFDGSNTARLPVGGARDFSKAGAGLLDVRAVPAGRRRVIFGDRTVAVRGPLHHGMALVVMCMVTLVVCVGTGTRTSTTWDEIIFMAAGARGYETGSWDLATDHPPLMQYVYGLPVYLSGPNYPNAVKAPDWNTFLSRDRLRRFFVRYDYARAFFWGVGNNPERLALYGRLIAAVFVLGLVGLTHAFVARYWGASPALLAASLVAFMPMVLAQGAIAYSDVPIALMMLATLWAMDVASRRPAIGRGMLAGALLGLTLSIKYTALVLAPAAAVILAAEALSRRGEREWRRALPSTIVAGLMAAYLMLVFVFRGDFGLLEARQAIAYTLNFVDEGRGLSYFIDREVTDLPWYAYPVMFLLRMPAAYHLLLLLGLAGLALGLRNSRRSDILGSRLRGPLIGGALVGAAALSTNLPAFRYILPALTLTAIPMARGVQLLSARYARWIPALASVLVLWYVGSSLSIYPHFLAYTSEWGPGRDRIQERFVDPSVDVGQALFDLRAWMAETGNEYVYLSNQGSGMPAGYGIRYVPLPSAYWIENYWPKPEQPPAYAVVSVTNLFYLFPLNPFAPLRTVEPDTVLGHVLLVYRMDRPEVSTVIDEIRREMERYE